MPINIIDFQKKIDELKISKKSIRFPDETKLLIDLASQSNVTDNPILMLVTMKSNIN